MKPNLSPFTLLHRPVQMLIVFVVVLFVNTSVNAQDNDKPLTIGFAQVGSESAWRVAFTNATLAEAKARGINLLFADADNSQETQIADLRKFIEQKVDAIIL